MSETPDHNPDADEATILQHWQAQSHAIEAARLDAARRVLNRRPLLKGLAAGVTLLAVSVEDLTRILAEGGVSSAYAQVVTTTLTTTQFQTTTVPFQTTTLFQTTTVPFQTTTLFQTTTVPFQTTTLFQTTTVPFQTTTLFQTTTVPFQTTTSFTTPAAGATPELGSLMLFGSGVGAMVAYGYRKLRGTTKLPADEAEDQSS